MSRLSDVWAALCPQILRGALKGFWFRSDWVNPFGGTHYNWIDFTLIQLSGEIDNRFGSVEFHAALLGLHVGVQWSVGQGDVELKESLKRMVDEFDSGAARISISLSEYDDLKARATCPACLPEGRP